MAQFTISVETGQAEAGVSSLATNVGGLSKEFDALQASMRAAETEMAGIAKMQQDAFAQHAKGGGDSMKDGGFDWQAAQKKAMAGHDQDAAARAGHSKMMQDLADKASGATQKFNAETFTATAATQGLTAAMGPYGQALQIVVDRIKMVANAIYDLAESAVRLTQEKDAIRATFDAFTSGGGQDMLDGLEDLAAQLPFTGDKLNGWAKSLLAVGIQGEALKSSIKAIASATAIMGESGGAAALGLIKRFAMMADTGQKVSLDRRILAQLAEAGISAKALAQALGVPVEKLGAMKIGAKELGDAMQKALIQQGAKPLEVMGQSVASIAAKLKEGWEDAFEDMGDIVGPFMAELQSLASEFFAGSIASGTFKDALRAGLSVVFKSLTIALHHAHIVLLQVEIAFLKAKIAVNPLTSALGKLADSGDIVTGILIVLATVVGALAIVAGICAVAMLIMLFPFIVIGVAIFVVIVAVRKLISLFSEMSDHMGDIKSSVMSGIDGIVESINGLAARAPGALAGFVVSALSAGGNFVLGLVQALTTGQGPVADAAKSLALAAKNAVFSAMGIRSPSRVMIQAGRHVSAGFALGIDDGAGDVEAAAQGTASAAVSGAAVPRGGSQAASGGGGNVTLNVAAGGIVINGAGGDVFALTVEALALALEQARSRAGLAPVGA